MGSYKIDLSIESETEFDVSINHFGGNVIGDGKNDVPSPSDASSDLESDSYFQNAIETLGVTQLRYPAGKAEEANITELEDGELKVELAEFIDFCAAEDISFTLVIPVREPFITDQTGMITFVELVYDRLGRDTELLQSIELGNEYWEEMGEMEYGQQAFSATGFLVNALDQYNSENSGDDVDPNILVQTGSAAGKSSDYHIDNYITDVPSFETRMHLANDAIIEQFDFDNDLSNGFQSTTESQALDGIVSHYYYNQTSNIFLDLPEEERRISIRDDAWNEALGDGLTYHITEWNVWAANVEQQGLKAAGVLLEQFENMLEAGVDFAEIWPIRENTTNAIAGGHNATEAVSLTPAGVVFSWMSESLLTPTGGLSLLSLGSNTDENIEIQGYQDAYRTVLYISSRTNEFDASVDLDWSNLVDASSIYTVGARLLSIDFETSDGFSQQRGYDENGDLVAGTGLARRTIDEAEANELREILGGAYREYFVAQSDQGLLTYLPPASTIFPMVTNPSSMDDFYFSAETDVSGLESALEINGAASETTFVLDPYEVVEITIDTSVTMNGTNGIDTIEGGYGRDTIFGNAGNDHLEGGEGVDTFVFATGDGQDTIHDFAVNEDILRINGIEFDATNPEQNFSLNQTENSLIVNYGSGDQITLSNVTFSDLGMVELFLGLEDTGQYGNSPELDLNDDDGHVVFVFNSTGGGLVLTLDTYDIDSQDEIEVFLGEHSLGHLEITGDNTWGVTTFNIDEGLLGAGETALYFQNIDESDNWSIRNVTLAVDPYVYGSDGRDTLSGGVEADIIFGYAENDRLLGGGGDDTIYGGANNDVLKGNDGNDILHGNDGNESKISGGAGNDTLYGGAGNDKLYGDEHNDILDGGSGADLLDGGDGIDVATYETAAVGVTVSLADASVNTGDAAGDSYTDIENISGSNFNDTLIGDINDNVIIGAGGSDDIESGDGRDNIQGGDGDDTIHAGAHSDMVNAGNGDDEVSGGSGDDIIFGETGKDTIDGGIGSDTIYGGGGSDILFGGAGADILYGGIGDDTIDGGDDADIINAGSGDDIVIGGASSDTLDGGEGADRLTGGAGNDILNGGSGNDVFVFDAAAATNRDMILDFSSGQDTLEFWGVEPLDISPVNIGSDLQIDWNGGSVLLVDIAAVTIEDFMFM